VGLFWLALAVTFGIRRPGGALLAGLAFAAGTAMFHWISSWSFLSGGDIQALITSVYFVPILSGIGAIQLAQNPDGILALTGQQKVRKKREKARLAKIAEAEAELHGGVVPEHELHHRTEEAAERSELAATGTTGLDIAQIAEATFAMHEIVAGYGDAEVLHGVDLRLGPRQGHGAARANGAGKSTLCSVAAGMVDASIGKVYLEGNDVTEDAPYQRARAGILLVPEARGIFPGLTVEENLTVLLRDEELPQQGVRAVPDPVGAAQAGGRLLSGGRAADAEPRPRPGRPSCGAHRRRAHPRPRAAGGRRGDGRHPRAAGPRLRRPPGRGERPERTQGGGHAGLHGAGQHRVERSPRGGRHGAAHQRLPRRRH